MRRLGLAAVSALSLLALAPGAASAATPVAIEYGSGEGISAGAGLEGIAAGPDGNLWFAERNGNKIGKITPAGVVTEYSTGISAGAGPSGITTGPDGNLWFTEILGHRIGKITPAGVVTEYSAGISAGAAPWGIAAGPDGNLWFTESGTDKIGKITTAGTVTEYSAGISAGAVPRGIAAGPDGNLWFTESGTDKIGKITTAGVVTEYSAGISAGAAPWGIAAGPDGNLWFTERNGDQIGKITPAGTVTEYSAGISADANPTGIAAGPDGNLWFTEFGGTSKIGKITTAGTVTEYTAGISAGAPGPNGIAAGPDGNLWFTEFWGSRVAKINTALDPPAFQNATAIAVPAGQPATTSGPAGPFPSEVTVSGLGGTVTDLSVRLTGISHNYDSDIDALLVGPGGEMALLASDVGGGAPDPHGVTLNIADSSPFSLPSVSPLVSGIFKPTNVSSGDTFSGPAPEGPYGTALSAFDGTDPNGTWQLFVQDDVSGDVGTIYGGWGLEIEASGPAAPTLTATDPASPANENNPKVTGSALAGSTVRLYTDVACTSMIGSPGTAAEFASPGIEVSVADDTTTSFYATATDVADKVSGCSSGSIAYTEVTPPPVVTPPAATTKPKCKKGQKLKKGKCVKKKKK